MDVVYNDFITSFDVKVKKELSGISWNIEPEAQFNQSDAFKAEGSIDLMYSDVNG